MTFTKKTGWTALIVTVFLSGTSCAAFAGADLDRIKQQDKLLCGVSPSVSGFSAPDAAGKWTGFDLDLCGALAAAILGDGTKFETTSLSYAARFTALQTGEVDVLTTNTTWNLQRDATLGVTYTGIHFYDGLGMLIPAKLGATSAKDLDGAEICLGQGGTAEAGIAAYFSTLGMTFKPVVFESQTELNAAFFGGRCDVFVSDTSTLAAVRAANAAKPDDYVILPEIVSKSPLSPVVRDGDNQFADIVRWTVNALVTAEELGVTSANADEMAVTGDDAVKRLLGSLAGNGVALGLDEKWALRAIKHAGNYGEMYDRHFGPDTSMNLPRNLNKLWTDGGLLYAQPM